MSDEVEHVRALLRVVREDPIEVSRSDLLGVLDWAEGAQQAEDALSYAAAHIGEQAARIERLRAVARPVMRWRECDKDPGECGCGDALDDAADAADALQPGDLGDQ